MQTRWHRVLSLTELSLAWNADQMAHKGGKRPEGDLTMDEVCASMQICGLRGVQKVHSRDVEVPESGLLQAFVGIRIRACRGIVPGFSCQMIWPHLVLLRGDEHLKLLIQGHYSAHSLQKCK